MKIIENTISQISIDQAIAYKNLTIYPLLGKGEEESEYMILDEAIALDCVRVTEVSESGSVPELLLKNEANKPILLLDGEELIGAKQNRIINLTILAPANQSIKIPVSCVEAGRWAHRSEAFSTSDRVFYSKGRSQKMDQVYQSLRRSRGRTADQSAIWNSISEKTASMNTVSATEAMADIFEQHESFLDKYCKAFCSTERQVGAVFAINGEMIGLERSR
ncbi:MAG: ARPP-1 family domain-containing protein [bacterium]